MWKYEWRFWRKFQNIKVKTNYLNELIIFRNFTKEQRPNDRNDDKFEFVIEAKNLIWMLCGTFNVCFSYSISRTRNLGDLEKKIVIEFSMIQIVFINEVMKSRTS